MLEGFSGASRIPELRRRLIFTALMLAVYRTGVAVPTPGIDGQALASFFDAASGTLFGWANLFSGGALERFSIFALGIMPYISVAIILDLLNVAWPYLDELYKEGEAGRRKITQMTRYFTVALAVVQGSMIAYGLEKVTAPSGAPVVYSPGFAFIALTVITVTVQFVREGEMSMFLLLFILVIAVGVIFGIVYIETAQRRIPIQYARRM